MKKSAIVFISSFLVSFVALASDIADCRSVDQITGKVSTLTLRTEDIAFQYGPALALFDGRKIEFNIQPQNSSPKIFEIKIELYNEGKLMLTGEGLLGGPENIRFYVADKSQIFNLLCVPLP